MDSAKAGTPELRPESSARNSIEGKLDSKSLESSLNEIVRRHGALRTIFPDRDGEPLQHVVPQLLLSMDTKVLETLPFGIREDEAERIAVEEANKPFDLTRGPLIRAVLLRMAGQEHLLLILMHHIVFDGWSENVFIQELQALYGAFAEGKESPLAELALQYADFAVWQNQRLSGRLDQELQYWKDNLSDMPTVLQLPSDYPQSRRLISQGRPGQ